MSFSVPLEALKDPGALEAEIVESCVDDATVGRYAGDFKRQDS
ncbi:hypothetical protein SAMN02745206_02984 [Desulfacinum infernum DSM 9756]|uniref:Uncharacterized protein n=1 Tax=Desulfacinum infernum DSM 9756 TaxID=1121391 RepID=A0A1M5FVJ6_9BACT|nr:hypothetical protein [Desulfacinum infernum]SHF95424.1 hypothetical protein SAMN02745206_02984 [Desulfacinum infernum DSM 9756]